MPDGERHETVHGSDHGMSNRTCSDSDHDEVRGNAAKRNSEDYFSGCLLGGGGGDALGVKTFSPDQQVV